MSNQATHGNSGSKPAQVSALDASAELPLEQAPDSQPVGVEPVAFGSSWSDSSSESEYGDEEEEGENGETAENESAKPIVEAVTQEAPTTPSDDSLVPSAVKTEANAGLDGHAAPDVDGIDEDFDHEHDANSEQEETPLDQSKFASFTGDEYTTAVSTTEAATSGAEDIAIDQALFGDFDDDNSAAIAKHNVIADTSVQALADNFDSDNSDLIFQYYGSGEAHENDYKRTGSKQKKHAPPSIEVRPALAVRFSRRHERPVPAVKHATPEPSSPGLKRCKASGLPFSSLPPLPSPLGLHASGSTLPASSIAHDAASMSQKDSEASSVSSHGKSTAKMPEHKFSFGEPRAAPPPPGGTKHRRDRAVCDTVASPESLLTSDEVLELTGISRETSRAFVKVYKASIKAIDAEESQAALNAGRSALNLTLASWGMPVVAASQKYRTARVADTPEKRQEYTNAFLHEYHERYVSLVSQCNVLSQKLKSAERDLKSIHAEMEKEMLNVQTELEECWTDRHSDQASHKLLQGQYDRLKDDTVQLELERLEAVRSLASLQDEFDKHMALQEANETQGAAYEDLETYNEELEARLVEFETRIEIMESQAHETQQRQIASEEELEIAHLEVETIRQELEDARIELNRVYISLGSKPSASSDCTDSDGEFTGATNDVQNPGDAMVIDLQSRIDALEDRCSLYSQQLTTAQNQLDTLHAAPRELTGAAHAPTYSDGGQTQLYEYQQRILQLQQENQAHIEKQNRLTALMNQVREMVETLEADKAALTLANETLQNQRPTLSPIDTSSISIEEPPKWAARRAAWRETPEWKARYALYQEQSRLAEEAAAAA
ncbi:hypothetical protein Slin14017_G068700 [Septoria linicola]|nr:hypothetical protein Slin14017_G068700 [Septoria linicola]